MTLRTLYFCVAGFLGVSPAFAVEHRTRYRQFESYPAEAVAAFGSAPKCAVRHIRVSAGDMQRRHPTLSGVAADADPLTCSVHYVGEWWDRVTPLARCVVMVHEYGHLLGLAHDADPESVMHANARTGACESVTAVRYGGCRNRISVVVWDRMPPALQAGMIPGWYVTQCHTKNP